MATVNIQDNPKKPDTASSFNVGQYFAWCGRIFLRTSYNGNAIGVGLADGAVFQAERMDHPTLLVSTTLISITPY